MASSVVIATALLMLLCTLATTNASQRVEACRICKCSQNNRVVKCEGRHLRSTARLVYPDNMQLLDLSKTNLTLLDEGAFKDAHRLVELSIQSSHLKVVHQDALKGLQRLERLDLGKNELEALPEGVFEWSPKLKFLSLQYNKISIQALGDALISAPNLEVLDINGLPMDTELDSGLTEGYASLSKLKTLLVEESIQNLTAEFFMPLSNSSLEYLSLAKSQFQNISIDAFMPLPHLKKLILAKTGFPTWLAENIFHGLHLANASVEYLDLRHNFIYDDEAGELTKDTFRHLEHVPVKILHLENSYGGFHGVIKNHFFQFLPHLEELYLDYSELRRISPQSFKELHKLRTLSLSNNYLHCLKGCEFLVDGHFKSLEHLDLSDNVITDQAKAFSFNQHNFPNLQTLLVKNNRLEVIEKSIFGGLRHLQKLDISRNPITRIEPKAFKGLRHLRQLKISDCPQLTEIEPLVFQGLHGVRSLHLDNNGLITLHPASFAGLEKLESLSLRNNKLGADHQFYYNVSITRANLSFIDLGQNELEALPAGLIRKQPLLTSLYLDHNRIMIIDSEVAAEMRGSIELLDLSYNDVMYVDGLIFAEGRFPRLRTLSLAGNPFLCSCPIAPFIQSLRDASRDPEFKLTAPERHLCLWPAHLQGIPLLSYDPSEWDCHIKLYFIPLIVALAVSIVLCTVTCVCRKRPASKDCHIEEYTEQDVENKEEIGQFTQTNGTVVSEAQTSSGSSMESSQSSITQLCVPLKSFRGKKQKNNTHAQNGNGHVLLNEEETDSEAEEPQDTEVDEADAIV